MGRNQKRLSKCPFELLNGKKYPLNVIDQNGGYLLFVKQ